MYTLITAKSLWTIICIGEITVLFVWLLEYGKDLLHVQYGRLFHFSIVISIHLNSPDENWKKVFLSMVCPLKMHRVSPVFVPLYTTCSIHGVFGHEKSIGASPTFKKNFPDPLVVKTCNIFSKTRYMFSPLGGQENFFLNVGLAPIDFSCPKTSRRKIDCAHSRNLKMLLPWPWIREIRVCIEAKIWKF